MRLHLITVCLERQYEHFSLSEQEDNFWDTFGTKSMHVTMKKKKSLSYEKKMNFTCHEKLGNHLCFISYEKLTVTVFGGKRQCSRIGIYLWRGIFQNDGATLYQHILFITISETESF